jgi:hypothetical protein
MLWHRRDASRIRGCDHLTMGCCGLLLNASSLGTRNAAIGTDHRNTEPQQCPWRHR